MGEEFIPRDSAVLVWDPNTGLFFVDRFTSTGSQTTVAHLVQFLAFFYFVLQVQCSSRGITLVQFQTVKKSAARRAA